MLAGGRIDNQIKLPGKSAENQRLYATDSECQASIDHTSQLVVSKC